MTRIQQYLELCLAWSLLLLSAAIPIAADAAEAVPVSIDIEKLARLANIRRQRLDGSGGEALEGEPHHNNPKRALQLDDGDTRSQEMFVPGYFATQAPTTAPRPGDFANLNELLQNTVIELPDTDINEMLLFQLLQVALRNLACTSASFEDIRVTPDLRSQQQAGLDFAVTKLGLNCELDFEWSYIFLVGNGHASVRVTDSSAAGTMEFTSEDFSQFPPDTAKFTDCSTDINIQGIDFSGNIASEIFNLFEQLIVNVLNDLLNDYICGELYESGADLLDEGLGLVDEYIGPYLEPVDPWRYNVTYPEDTMNVPENVSVIGWNDDSGFGEFMTAAMDEMESLLSSLQEDEYAPNVTLAFPNGTEYPDGYDLGINVMLRSYLLEDDRSFTVDGSYLSDFNTSAVLIGWHDEFLNCNISLVSLKVYGLDTFTVMEPFQRIQNHTIQNALSWDYLSFDVTVKVEFLASSMEGSIIRDTERTEPYEEEIRMTVGVEDINTVLSVMVALDTERMRDLQLGSLVDLVSMIPCVLSSLHDVALAGMNITLGDIQLPTIEGLVSPGLDRLLQDAADLGFFLYKATVLDAIPSLFESTIRDLATQALDDTGCTPVILDEEDSFVDLRELLLDVEDAREAGATGSAPYGDLTATIYGIAQEMWQEVEEDGSLGLNSLVIDPLTEGISGVEGRFSMDGILYNFTTNEENQKEFKELVNKFEFNIYDLVVENLNTIVHPMAVLQPINHPYITQSTINMGPMEGAPLNASISMRMSLDIEDSPLAMDNVVTMGFSMSSAEVFLEALTMLSANDFLNYRLGDGFDTNCWFALMTPPKLDHEGYRVEGGMDRGVELRRLLAKVSDLQLHMECIQCSPGLASLPEIVDIFERTKVTPILSYRMPLLLEEVAISDCMQVHIDRWLVDAPYYCPHRPEYIGEDGEYERPETWEAPEFDHLSVEASDTIFFTPLVALEVGFVLLVETHYPWELDTLQPLSGQQNFVAPEGSDLIDWTDLNSLGKFDNLTDDFRSYLSEVRYDPESGETDLGINLIVRDWFGGPDRQGSVDIVGILGEPIEFVILGVVFQIHELKVRGLDSFTSFNALKPIAPQTILNSMHLRYLEIDVNVTAGSRTAPEQYLGASFKFKDLNASIPLFAAIDKGILSSKELGHFLRIGDGFSCFLSSALDIHFPQVLIQLGEMSTPTFSGFLSDSGEALKQSMEEVFERYGTRALKALPIMFDVSGRGFVNTFIEDFIAETANCTHIIDYIAEEETLEGEAVYPYTDFVDFRELFLPEENSTAMGGMGKGLYGDFARSIVNPLREEFLWVDPKTGLSSANEFLGPLFEFMSDEEGTLIIPGHVVPNIPTFNPEIGSVVANVTFEFGDIRVENIDTMGDPLSLLGPVFMRPFNLENSFGFGLGGRPLRVSARFKLAITSWEGNEFGRLVVKNETINDMIITLTMNDAVALLDILTKIPEAKLVHFPMADVFNPYCWASLFTPPKLNIYGVKEEGEVSAISLLDVAVTVAKLNMTIECIECQSPGAFSLVESLSSPGAVESVTEIANTALDVLSSLVKGNLIGDQIDRFFNAVPRYCPHHPDYVEGAQFSSEDLFYEPLNFSTSIDVNNLVYLVTAVVFSLVIGGVVITTVVRWVVNRRHQKWLRDLPVQKVLIIQHLQDADDQLEKELNNTTASMILAGEIPAWIRYLMPFIVIGNVALFLSGHLNIAADVAMTIKIAGENIPMDQFYSFAILETVIEMWYAGAEELAIFMLTFSVIWPYVKQLISLACWVIPPTSLSISTRGSVYLWLDTLAKWSIVDIFVTLLYMIAFRVDASTPDVAFLPVNFFAIEFYIIPRWGIYANLLAQIISQISSHYIIYYHRAIVRRATKSYDDRHLLPSKAAKTVCTSNASDEPSDASDHQRGRLCDGAFARPHKGEKSKLISRQIASYGLVVGTFLLIVFLILGNSLSILSVEVQGLMSYISGEDAYKAFSVFDLAALLFNDGIRLGGFSNIAGHLLLGVLLIATVFLVPVIQAVALAFQWFKPMSDAERRKLSTIIEILGAWQYAEVFILAVVVGAWQQGQTSELVMQEQCADFNEVFKMLVYYGVITIDKGHCFRVESTILAGSYFLLVGAVMLAILNTFVGKATFHYFWDKECIRKEEAMDEHLTFAEESAALDDKKYKSIRAPPVLFTDTFRWLLRAEHLGDRPLKSEQPLDLVVGHNIGLAVQEEKLSIASSSSSPGKSVDVTVGADEPSEESSDPTTVEC